MYCKNCGSELQEGNFCQECGKPITPQNIEGKKNPYLAAGLNLVVAGVGFLYIRQDMKCLYSLIAVIIMALINPILGIIGLIIVMILSYKATVEYNESLPPIIN
jgi:uncharacterized membrane protein YvbJ